MFPNQLLSVTVVHNYHNYHNYDTGPTELDDSQQKRYKDGKFMLSSDYSTAVR